MAVDQARQYGGCTEIDDLRAHGGRFDDVVRWSDRADTLAGDRKGDVREIAAGANVEQTPDPNDDIWRGRFARRGLSERYRGRSKREDDGDDSGLPWAMVDHTASPVA
jgi:hypothetical protein